MNKQKGIIISVIIGILLLWFGAAAVIVSHINSQGNGEVSSYLSTSKTTSAVSSQMDSTSSVSEQDPTTVDPATNTIKTDPVEITPKDNGQEQVTILYYTESDELKGFFSLTGKWVCVYLQLDNWSNSKIVTPYDFVLVADGVSYHVSDLNQAGSDPLEATGVGQNASLQGTLIYEVPLDAEQYQLQYISDNGTISFELN